MGQPSYGSASASSPKLGASKRSRDSSICRATAPPRLMPSPPELRSLAGFLFWSLRSVAHLQEVGTSLSALPGLLPASFAGILPSNALLVRRRFCRQVRVGRNAAMVPTLLPVELRRLRRPPAT